MTDRERIEMLEQENTALALEVIKANAKCNAAWGVVMAASELIDVRGFNGERQCAIVLKAALSKLDEVTK
jgi:hypothetical protein